MDHQVKKQPLLYADLFKPHIFIKTTTSTSNSSSIMSADSNHSSSTFDSSLPSSSASFTSDGEFFVHEFTHQIPEDCMLQQQHKTSFNHPNSVFLHNNKYRRDDQKGHFKGSDMHVFFLGGSGSRSTSTGTGVFFPRVNNYGPAPPPVDQYLQQKPGCTTVLIPTRVLQVLENLHFNKLHADSDLDSDSDSSLQTFTPGSRYINYHPNNNFKDGSKNRPNAQQKLHVEEMELPQEWTY